MGKDISRTTLEELTVAAMVTAVSTHIDNIWAAVDVSHAPSALELTAYVDFTVSNAGGTSRVLKFIFNWYEDATVQNTRMKEIFGHFATALTAMEGASSYTTVNSLKVTISMCVDYV